MKTNPLKSGDAALLDSSYRTRAQALERMYHVEEVITKATLMCTKSMQTLSATLTLVKGNALIGESSFPNQQVESTATMSKLIIFLMRSM
jgi:hypothetical protein